jgi:hypothetical protein
MHTLHCEKIIFIDNNTVANVDCAIYEGFLIVSGNEDEQPTWYNLSQIARLEGVTSDKACRVDNRQIRFFR